jgi:DNA-binding transcriptional regulator YdaS (Cro superfamily)
MRKPQPKCPSGVRQAIAAAGGIRGLAVLLGISTQAVGKWRRVPAERVIEVERVTGVPRTALRPDLYPEN